MELRHEKHNMERIMNWIRHELYERQEHKNNNTRTSSRKIQIQILERTYEIEKLHII